MYGDRMLRQKLRRKHCKTTEARLTSMRFMTLLWLWSEGSHNLMIHAWESQHNLEELFNDTDELNMPSLLLVLHEYLQLSPTHSKYPQEQKFLNAPAVGVDQKMWLHTWKFYVAWKLAHAVVEKNVKQGTSVPSDWILTTHERFLHGKDENIPKFLETTATRWWEGMNQNARLIWLCRWRKEWGFKFGTLQPRGHMLADELQRKA